MPEPWLVYLAVFVLVSVGVHQAQRAWRGADLRRRQKRKRFAALGTAASADALALRRRPSSAFARSRLVQHVRRTFLQSGTALSPRLLGLVGLAVALCAYIALAPIAEVVLRALIALVLSAGTLWAWLRWQRSRRMARFAEQLPDILDIIVRSLRAGHPLPISLGLIAREAREPARSEFATAVAEINYGRSVSEAMENLYQRVGYPELRFLVASISIAHQTGGNLGEILSRLSRLLRDRFRLSRRVRALSAEGRFSGLALSILPIVLFGLINVVSASYYADFWASPAARPVLTVSLALLLVGNVLIYRLVNFRV